MFVDPLPGGSGNPVEKGGWTGSQGTVRDRGRHPGYLIPDSSQPPGHDTNRDTTTVTVRSETFSSTTPSLTRDGDDPPTPWWERRTHGPRRDGLSVRVCSLEVHLRAQTPGVSLTPPVTPRSRDLNHLDPTTVVTSHRTRCSPTPQSSFRGVGIGPVLGREGCHSLCRPTWVCLRLGSTPSPLWTNSSSTTGPCHLVRTLGS